MRLASNNRLITAAIIASLATLATLISLISVEARPPKTLFVQVPDSFATPTVSAKAETDSEGITVLRISTKNFIFLSICKTLDKPEAAGHAHVYSNNRKIAAAYQPIVVLGKLAPGRHEFTISLQATDHRALVTKHGMITTDVVVQIG